MKAPVFTEFNDRRYCSSTLRERLEYALWQRGVAKLADLIDELDAQNVSAPCKGYAGVALRNLIHKGQVEKVARGVYRHLDSPFA